MTKLRLLIGATVAILTTLAFSPLSASGDALKTFNTTLPETTPPLHGTLPHGEGTVAVTQLASDPTRPYSNDPSGKTMPSELLVVGRSRGEQRADGTFHGHITIAQVAGTELLSVDTMPGETKSAPTAALLDPVCTATGVCLVTANSTTSTTGSSNHFETAGLRLSAGAAPGASLPLGVGLLSASAASSDGNITTDGTCTTATGQSTVAGASLGGVILAKVIKSSTISKACNNAPATETDSSTVTPADNPVGNLLISLPATGCSAGGNALPDGTPGGVANDPSKGSLLNALSPVLDVVCNSADQNPTVPTNSAEGGQQATSPYGVREALNLFVLATSATPLIKVTTAGADSTANSPPCSAGQTGTPPNCVAGPTTCPAGQTGTPPNCTTPTKTTTPSKHVCNTGGDNDCLTGSGPTGPSIPEGGATDKARDCREHVEGGNCPGGGEGGGGPTNAKTASTLPFTGLDPLPIGILGVLLLGTGLAMRRFSGLVD